MTEFKHVFTHYTEVRPKSMRPNKVNWEHVISDALGLVGAVAVAVIWRFADSPGSTLEHLAVLASVAYLAALAGVATILTLWVVVRGAWQDLKARYLDGQ